MMCMPGSLGNLWSATHWLTALQTGLVTGVAALLLSFTPVARLYGQRLGNAAIVGGSPPSAMPTRIRTTTDSCMQKRC
jgi:hypothetical protein